MIDKKVYLRRGQIVEKITETESATHDSSRYTNLFKRRDRCIVETPPEEMPTMEKPLGARLEF